MKNFVFAGSWALAVTAVACAQQSTPTPPEISKLSTTQAQDLSPVYTVGKCSFRLRLNGGTVAVHNESSFQSAGYYPPGEEEWSLPMLCHAGASAEKIDGLLAAKQINGKWIWEGTGQPFTLQQHFKVYEFSGEKWHGVATAYDDTTGDEATRGRTMFFCLTETKGPQALCGGPISIRALVDPPSISTLPKIMSVLKTVEFVDSNAPPAPSTSALSGY